MVAPKPGERLLLYIMVTTEVVSMVLVIERLEPHQHQKPQGTPAASSSCLDLGPIKGVGVEEVDGSQTSEAPLSPVTQVGSHVVTKSQLPGAPVGSSKQEAIGSLDPEALLHPRG
jgi:hypothetical protein